MTVSFLLLGALVLAAPSAPAETPPEHVAPAAAAVREFYDFHFAHDKAFTADAIAARARWLSPGLVELCKSYFARPTAPDEVPAIDGDPFTDAQEYPTGFALGKTKVTADRAVVAVWLTDPGRKRRKVEIVVVHAREAWLIDDVLSPLGPSLRELLAAEKTAR